MTQSKGDSHDLEDNQIPNKIYSEIPTTLFHATKADGT